VLVKSEKRRYLTGRLWRVWGWPKAVSSPPDACVRAIVRVRHGVRPLDDVTWMARYIGGYKKNNDPECRREFTNSDDVVAAFKLVAVKRFAN